MKQGREGPAPLWLFVLALFLVVPLFLSASCGYCDHHRHDPGAAAMGSICGRSLCDGGRTSLWRSLYEHTIGGCR